MKVTTLLKTSLLIFISTAVMITACKKDNSSNPSSKNDDSTAANLSASSATADNAYDDVFSIALQTGSDNNIVYGSSSSLGQVGVNGNQGGTTTMGDGDTIKYTVTPAGDVFPKTIVVDFGTGVTGPYGIIRKGKITYVFSGRLATPGTTVSATFTDYYINGYKLEGTYSATNTSTINGNSITFSFTTSVSNGKITYPDGTTWYTYSGSKKVVQTDGTSTLLDASDDVYSVTGSNTIASSSGNTLKDSITTALVKKVSCRYVSSGIISFTFNDVSGTLDYGDGTCDNKAVIKVGAINLEVELQ
jgi:hypothetical protein